MRAFDCMEKACAMLGDAKGERALELINSGESLSGDEQFVFRNYMNALNIALDTICSRYYANVARKVVTSDKDSKINYSDLDLRVYEVVAVKRVSGDVVEHYSLPFSLLVPKPNTEYVVIYKYLPPKVTREFQNLEVMPCVDINTVAYLMASDISLANGLYADSKFWFSEFEASINRTLASRRMRTLAVSRLI